jgi:hypothetical protein
MAIDSSGNVYVAGYTTSTDFPGLIVGTSPPIEGAQIIHAGGVSDAFISKFNPDLTTLLQSTYLGGNGGDSIYGIAVNSDSIFVTGTTSSNNFPGIAGGAQTSMSSGSGGFVSRLSLDLTEIIQSTYLAGNSGAFPFTIAVTGTNVYVAGWTSSTGFPNVSGGGQESYGGGDDDGFVSRLDLGLQHILQSTYLGGSGDENVTGMVIEGNYIYLTGRTYSNNLPARTGAAQPNFSGNGFDAFVSKVSLDLTQIVRSTYLGGASGDLWVRGMDASASGLYVVGRTRGGSIINTAGGAQPTQNSGTEAFVSKVNLDLTEIVQSTYLGGQVTDWGQCIALAPDGSVYVAGQTMSSDIPGRAGGAYPNIKIGTGSWDGFVSRLNSELTQIMQSTYLGGDDYEEIFAIAIGPDTSIYVAGDTTSINLPGTLGGARISKAGGYFDAFVSRFDSTLAGVVYVSKTVGCGGKTPCYNSIDSLFLDYQINVNSNLLGNLVKITGETYNGNVTLNSSRVVTMEGSWNSSFTAVQTKTIIHGTLTITQGTIDVQGLILQ